jgi:hypothetical protein
MDFTKMRMAYAGTENYDPYNFEQGNIRKDLDEALDQGNYSKVSKLAEQALEKNLLFPRFQWAAFYANDQLGNAEEANFHYTFLDNLVNSILESGDGKTPETAFVVISVEEEYLLLGWMEFQTTMQEFVELENHYYDQFQAIDPDTGEEVSIYFNIDLPYGHLVEVLSEKIISTPTP